MVVVSFACADNCALYYFHAVPRKGDAGFLEWRFIMYNGVGVCFAELISFFLNIP